MNAPLIAPVPTIARIMADARRIGEGRSIGYGGSSSTAVEEAAAGGGVDTTAFREVTDGSMVCGSARLVAVGSSSGDENISITLRLSFPKYPAAMLAMEPRARLATGCAMVKASDPGYVVRKAAKDVTNNSVRNSR